MRNWKIILILIAVAILLSFAVSYVKAESNLVLSNGTVYNFSAPPSPTVTTTMPQKGYYLQQGDTAYVNQTIDISGVVPPYPYLAYWDGFDMYDENATYQIDLSNTPNSGYYNFYIDPAIFSTRLGKWYKYNGNYERAGNNLAFVVAVYKPIMINTTNLTYQNPNQTTVVLPVQPILPVQHISDYLIARGYNFTINTNQTANVWIFGSRDFIYDYQSSNNSINMTREMMSDLQAGDYKILLQFPRNDTNDFMVRYNPNTSAIEWFDSASFKVNTWDTLGQSPENVLNELETVFPQTRDTFMLFKLSVQEPTITINRADVTNAINETQFPNFTGTNLEPGSFVDVRGYTNLPPDTPIILTVNPNFNLTGDTFGNDTVATRTEGTVGGDMRTFKAIIPIRLYDLPLGRNFIGAKVPGMDLVTTADFWIYGSPDGNFVPNKTIRYVSGQYGPEEMVPTPTPVVVTKYVPQIVTQIVTVPVTPTDQQVHDQQAIVAQEREIFWIGTLLFYGGVIIGVFFIGRFLFRALKRRAWLKK